MVQLLERWSFVAIENSPNWLLQKLEPVLSGLASLKATHTYSKSREMIMCPAGAAFDVNGAPDRAAVGYTATDLNDSWFQYAFDDAGVSVVCRLCQWVDPGYVVLGFVALMFASLLYPSREWPFFARIFEALHEIFLFEFVIDQKQFNPTKRYVFVAVPHGIIPLGSFMAIAYIRRFLPNLDAKLGVASVLFRMPFLRQFFLWLGCVPASRENLATILERPGGKVAIMSGGIAEIFLSCRKREEVYLKRRKGFVRLAIASNAEIVPVYIFGQTKYFDQIATNESVLMRLSRRFAASLTIFWGRYYLPIPYAARTTCVIGEPIKVTALTTSQGDAVEEIHVAVCDAIQSMHSTYRAASGYPDDELEII